MAKRAETRRRNREALIASARELILRDGARVQLDAITAQANLMTGAIYSIFGSKQALLMEVFEEIVNDVKADLAHLNDPTLSLEQVMRGCAHAFCAMATHPDAAQRFHYELVLFEIAHDDVNIRDRLIDTRKAMGERLAELLTGRHCARRGRPTSDAEAQRLAAALQALLHGLTQASILAPGSITAELFSDSAAALASLLDDTIGSLAEADRSRASAR